jgi:hypothetical protein
MVMAGEYHLRTSRLASKAQLGYVLRPPMAQEHITFTEEGLVAIRLKKPSRDGTVSVKMDLEAASRPRGRARTMKAGSCPSSTASIRSCRPGSSPR